jgi:hypothetical protein
MHLAYRQNNGHSNGRISSYDLAMRLFRISALVIALVVSTLPQSSYADNVEACRVPDTKWSAVSLGFPVRQERLKYVPKPKVLVIPFHPSDAPGFTLGPEEKASFLESGKDIEQLSSGLSKIEFVFNPTIKLSMTTAELDKYKINVRQTYLKDFENDQFGFSLKFIEEADPGIDYTGIDSVILYGFSKQSKEEIASALQFTTDMNFFGNNSKRRDGKPWFAPIVTNEKVISNVILMYNRAEVNVITHELLHNYGLTDLYGGTRTPYGLSRMADGPGTTLLTYEKWVLGWHPEQNVTCISGNDSQKINKIEIDIRDKEQIALLRPNQQNLFVIETARVKEDLQLNFYKLINDARPPIEYFSYTNFRPGVKLSDFQYGNFPFVHPADEFTLLIYSVTDTLATFYIYPNSVAKSAEVQALVTESRNIQDAKIKEAAELRAKLDAEFLAAQELKAKQEAEAKAAAEKLAAAKAAAQKKTTITCVKGKSIKKVTAAKPKCPSGYKKR